MKVVSIFGSPRKKGNTATVLNWVEEALREDGHEVQRIAVTDNTVNGCLECYTCQKSPDKPGCPQKDDAVAIFERMMEADALLYASPLFCWSWPSQIKTLVDRHFCLVTWLDAKRSVSLLEGKRSALLVTSGGGPKGNADLLIKQFRNLMLYIKSPEKGSLLVPFCTSPDKIPSEVREQAVQLARDLVS